MKISRYLTLWIWFATVSCLAGCGGGGASGGGGVGGATTSTKPVAVAGHAQNVIVGTLTTLDGSKSTCAAGNLITYQWSLSSRPAGSGAALQKNTATNPTLIPDLPGQYVVKLTVYDQTSASAVDTVEITASNAATNAVPVANAGAAQNVLVGTQVTLNGSGSSDADGDLLTYAWTIASKPNGSTAILSNPTQVTPTFTPDVAGAYALALTVNDGTATSAATGVTVTAYLTNAPPVADAGVTQNVLVGSTVTLDGSRSSDANGNMLTYRWSFSSLPAGSAATVAAPATVNASFKADLAGTYVLSLVVNDGLVDSAPATVIITASITNAVPVADAGPDQKVVVGASVTLDGSGSSDADGDTLTYRWRVSTQPAGSTVSLTSTSVGNPNFVANAVGSYVFTLIVNDGTVDSSAATVIITSIADKGSVSISW